MRFRTRLLAYLSIWFLAMLTLQTVDWLGLADEYPKERLYAALCTPLLAVFGLGRALAGPGFSPNSPAFILAAPAAVACLIAICVLTLTARMKGRLAFALCLHAGSLALALPSYLRLVAEINVA